MAELVMVELVVVELLMIVELARPDKGVDEEDSKDVGGLVRFPLNVSRNSTVVVEKFKGSLWPIYVVYAPCPTLPFAPAHV